MGVGRLGLGRGQVRLGLVDLRLKLHFLDLVEQVARLYILALAEQDFFEEALDARAHLDLVDGLDPPDEFEGPGHALHGRRPDANGWRRRRCGGRFALLTTAQQRQDQANGRQYMRAAGEFSRHANLHQACAFVLTGSFSAMVASGDFRQLLPVASGAQNIVLALADASGIGWITSQCSRTLPPSRRKMSTTASPRGLSDRPCQ